MLRKALESRLPVVLVVNKVDRPDARIDEVVDEVEELFLDLDADQDQLDFPIVYCLAREGRASLDGPPTAPACPRASTLKPLFDLLVTAHPRAHLRPRRAAAGAGHQPGRLAVRRPPGPVPHPQRHAAQGHQTSPGAGPTAAIERAKLTELYVTDALDRVPADEAGPGEIVAIAGLPEVTIGETLADLDDPRPLPVITIDEPSLAMTIGINTSPLSGREGRTLTARLVKSRLDQELVGNVSIRVLPTERPDTWEVQGRGELQLAVLVEMMRREGFELTVGKPQVLTREIDGKVHEPVERVTVDVPEEYLGAVTQLLALRKGRMEQIINHGTGWVRLEYLVPARGLVGLPHRVPDRDPGHRAAAPRVRALGAVGGRDPAPAQRLARGRPQRPDHRLRCINLQERGQLFVGPGTEVYEGMIVGENARPEDMDVNLTREKKLTNVRAATAESFEKLIPARLLSLEQALEFIADDECVEVTPRSVRLRKVDPGPDRPGPRRQAGQGLTRSACCASRSAPAVTDT